MRHFNDEQWLHYVQNKVDEKNRPLYEEHLLNCDPCHASYIKAVETSAMVLPEVPVDFTEQVLNHVARHGRAGQGKPENRSMFQNRLFHYIIAAAMTIVLMSTGLFGQLSHIADTFEEQSIMSQDQSLTEQIMAKTVSILQLYKQNGEVK